MFLIHYNDNDFYTHGSNSLYDSMFLPILTFAVIAIIAIYIISAIFEMRLLKNAGHRHPVSAWVPVWNVITLWEIGGIRKPWVWISVMVIADIVSGFVPGLGFVSTIFIYTVSIMVTVWMAKGVHAGMHQDKTGWIILAILVPFVWLIWAGTVSKNRPYDVKAAIDEGETFPFNWFGSGDPMAPFKD